MCGALKLLWKNRSARCKPHATVTVLTLLIINPRHILLHHPHRLIELMPDDASGYSNRGYAYRKLGNYAAAVEDYTAAIARCGSTVRLHNNRAYCLAKLGSYQEAISDYSAVLGIDPANVHAFHNRGISYDKLGAFEQAITDFNTVIEMEPTNSVAYFNRGSTYDSMGLHDQAVADFGRALELDPGARTPDAAPGVEGTQQE